MYAKYYSDIKQLGRSLVIWQVVVDTIDSPAYVHIPETNLGDGLRRGLTKGSVSCSPVMHGDVERQGPERRALNNSWPR